jgi:hypothetical protein
MYRIDEFLKYYNSLKDCQVGDYDGKWVNAQPLPFSYGFLTLRYWKEKINNLKDAWHVFKGDAIAISWKHEFKNKNFLSDDILFDRIWEAIKHWDIDNGRPIEGTDITGYSSVTGDDVRLIIDAIKNRKDKK